MPQVATNHHQPNNCPACLAAQEVPLAFSTLVTWVPQGTCGYPPLGTCRYLRCLWVSPAFCTVVFWAPLLSPESSPHLVNFFVAFLFTISASAPCFCSAQLNSTTHQVLSLLTCLKTFSLPPTSPSHNRGILVLKKSITAGFRRLSILCLWVVKLIFKTGTFISKGCTDCCIFVFVCFL